MLQFPSKPRIDVTDSEAAEEPFLMAHRCHVEDTLHSLFYLAAEGQLTPEQSELLSAALRKHSEARQLWYEIQDVECGLRELFAALN
ncbi:MAG: hypothetical protein RLZZ142_1813 [Verrucomicrobiota bacterium]|jgi:hypothetical protein